MSQVQPVRYYAIMGALTFLFLGTSISLISTVVEYRQFRESGIPSIGIIKKSSRAYSNLFDYTIEFKIDGIDYVNNLRTIDIEKQTGDTVRISYLPQDGRMLLMKSINNNDGVSIMLSWALFIFLLIVLFWIKPSWALGFSGKIGRVT